MLNTDIIFRGFKAIDHLVEDKVNLLIGGGAAILLHDIMSIATYDIDAIPFKSLIGPEEIKVYRDKVAQDLGLPRDWINEYFYQFTHCLPPDYGNRLKTVYQGTRLTCFILHPTDIAIMKLFAGRGKDQNHLKVLIQKGHVDMDYIDDYLNDMVDQHHPGAEKAQQLFNDLVEALGL